MGWRIMQQTQQVLLPDGKLVLFQYSLQNKRLFERFFRLLDDTYVLLNIPPAHVLVYTPEDNVTADAKATGAAQNNSAKVPA
ncbi:hypothetical protein H8B13_01430 [Hymenobacter sp. BT188]|uniref:hypothetical protein n=1 Tax=Hymenobacter sp. BT188 TaxID=2763504 RepID=UPI00165172FA|nr:hypothetical protein [Hymenobacter sp. BT188]MBC6605471.1 hypothetical protein [Hymenobacter sp. BT188]